jgi:putative ABC transport system permease protein
LIFRLVIENLKHRPVRNALSVVLIGAQVTMILALVGVSHGVLDATAERMRGTGADILVRPPDSAVISFSSTMPEGIVDLLRGMDHVSLATGVYVHTVTLTDSITGINPDEFNRMSGGMRLVEGRLLEKPDDLVVDPVFAKTRKVKPGDTFDMGHKWRIAGIIEGGKLSRTFADITALRDIFAEPGKVSAVYVKLDDPNNAPAVIDAMKVKLEGYNILSMEEFLSLLTVDSVPFLTPFINVVIGIATIVGFLVTLLSMYMAVQERTREIGILKAMGASPGYIMGVLLRETLVLSMAGILAGILMAYGTRALLAALAPSFPQEIVPDWYPKVALIAMAGSMAGAIYPGLKAARQDAIEALAYD